MTTKCGRKYRTSYLILSAPLLVKTLSQPLRLKQKPVFINDQKGGKKNIKIEINT